LDVFGLDAQLGMAQEECAEFIIAINKYRRGASLEHVTEELADVIIVMSQLMTFVNPVELGLAIDNKMKRLQKRIDRFIEEGRTA